MNYTELIQHIFDCTLSLFHLITIYTRSFDKPSSDQNPFYEIDMPVRCELFNTHLEKLLLKTSGSGGFSKTKK